MIEAPVLTVTHPTRFGWRTVVRWEAAFLGFPLGGLAALVTVNSVDNPLDGLVGGTLAGLILGTTQWLALRKTGLISGRWIAATGLGMGVGVALAVALAGAGNSVPEILTRAPLTGLILGVTQALELRQKGKLALLWVPLNILAYSAGWLVTQSVIKENVSNGFATFGASGALLFQALTGLGLYWLYGRKSSHA